MTTIPDDVLRDIERELEAQGVRVGDTGVLVRNGEPIWRSQDGRLTPVAKMATPHLLNALAMLRRKGDVNNPIVYVLEQEVNSRQGWEAFVTEEGKMGGYTSGRSIGPVLNHDPLIGCTLCSGKPVRYWRDSFPHPRGGTVIAAGYCDRCAERFEGEEGLIALEEPMRRSHHDARLKRFRPKVTPDEAEVLAEKEPAADGDVPVALPRFRFLRGGD